jgi:16S rRNA (uracil1498-N3)-methyltransferase
LSTLPRFFVDLPLAAGLEAELPADATRHVQVLRLQPGDAVLLFDGGGADWPAELLSIGRAKVRVRVAAPQAVECELPLSVTLAVGMPANERMDWLIEKATELGASAIQPLLCERSVLRVSGERADRKLQRWQALAGAAAEQCGRARLPRLQPVRLLADWLADAPAEPSATAGFVLSLAEDAQPLAEALCPALRAGRSLLFLSGPEGGLGPAEEAAARRAGLQPVTLGSRVLRAETAPLAALAVLAALCA